VPDIHKRRLADLQISACIPLCVSHVIDDERLLFSIFGDQVECLSCVSLVMVSSVSANAMNWNGEGLGHHLIETDTTLCS